MTVLDGVGPCSEDATSGPGGAGGGGGRLYIGRSGTSIVYCSRDRSRIILWICVLLCRGMDMCNDIEIDDVERWVCRRMADGEVLSRPPWKGSMGGGW